MWRVEKNSPLYFKNVHTTGKKSHIFPKRNCFQSVVVLTPGLYRGGTLWEGDVSRTDLQSASKTQPLWLLQGVSRRREDPCRPGAQRHDASGRPTLLQIWKELLPEQRQLAPLGAAGGRDEVHQLLVWCKHEGATCFLLKCKWNPIFSIKWRNS